MEHVFAVLRSRGPAWDDAMPLEGQIDWFGAYLRAPTGGIRHGTGLFVLTLAGDRISAMTRFDSSVLRWFGLPQSFPD
jgi:hypothetical protein